ncbi:hypothetical protein [Magnetospirillum sp. ME-1]|uniref:hypothetical protein n=1 Tax=Magnetospirillum sp. ME-1 TaxID=1639348 RepID=UPI0011AE4D9D|nr:hypothetical protein [Magnetospirillum sp. ME-1]
MVEIVFAGYLRRWQNGGLKMNAQWELIQAAVAAVGGHIVVVFIEEEIGRWDWRKQERPALEAALAFCNTPLSPRKVPIIRLVTPQWGGKYRDYRLNETLANWNEISCERFLYGTPVKSVARIRKGPKRNKPRSMNITKPHGFASPNRADAAESRIRGLQTQIEKRQAHFDDIKNVAELAVKLGFDTPQKLKAYLDESGVKTVTGKCWSRQAASNLLKQIKTDHLSSQH